MHERSKKFAKKVGVKKAGRRIVGLCNLAEVRFDGKWTHTKGWRSAISSGIDVVEIQRFARFPSPPFLCGVFHASLYC